MTGKRRQYLKDEKGAVQIVEAAFVFPVMFIILFSLIYMGNLFYIKAQVESVVAENAIRGASYCVDPLLENLKETGSVPSLSNLKIKPYRYLFGGMEGIEQEIGRRVKEGIENSSASFFKNMAPSVKTNQGEIAKFHNYVLFSTFSVDVKCDLEFPIRFLGASTPKMVTLNSHAESAVSDTTEFIRNTDMVIDYFEDTKLGQSIKGVFEKISDFLGNFASL